MCCLVETFPQKHTSLADYEATLRSALLYAKIVTLGSTHWPQTNAVMLRNRRIGTSMSGIAQFIAERGMGELVNWCRAGYAVLKTRDVELSERFAVTQSIKITSIKPSGTVSLCNYLNTTINIYFVL
jgi:ribonucleoside-triphosphate reductase (thioredoxin)